MFDRYGIHIGILYIHYYGIILMIGVIAAAVVGTRRAKAKGENPDLGWDMLTWLVIGGVIGARLWHIFTPSASMIAEGKDVVFYLTHPLDVLEIWNGGLGIPGAVLGGALALLIYTRNHKLSFARWVDYIAPGLILAQAIGRWGNFVNQELYGLPTNLPWKIYIEPGMRRPYMDADYYHPLFLYESLWDLGIMGALLWLDKRFEKRLKPGDLMLIYCILYPFGRFFLEFLRVDFSPVFGVNINQAFMAVVTIAATAFLVWRHWQDFKPAAGNTAVE